MLSSTTIVSANDSSSGTATAMTNCRLIEGVLRSMCEAVGKQRSGSGRAARQRKAIAATAQCLDGFELIVGIQLAT